MFLSPTERFRYSQNASLMGRARGPGGFSFERSLRFNGPLFSRLLMLWLPEGFLRVARRDYVREIYFRDFKVNLRTISESACGN